MIAFKNTSSIWLRYTNYEVRTFSDIEYVMPSSDAKPIIYNIMENPIEMVLDALNAGREIETEESFVAQRQAVLTFTRKHGLLGWMRMMPLDNNPFRHDSIYLKEENPLLVKTMPKHEYLRLFFPTLDESAELAEPQFSNDFENTLFALHYAERVYWTGTWLKFLYRRFMIAQATADPEDVRGFDVSSYFGIEKSYNNVAYEVDTRTSQMSWVFTNLESVIHLTYGLLMADEKKPLRLCKNCATIFHSTNSRSEFCTVRCRNQYNVRQFRERNS